MDEYSNYTCVFSFLSVRLITYCGMCISALVISGFRHVSVSDMHRACLHATRSLRKGILVLLLRCNSSLILSMSICVIPMFVSVVAIPDMLTVEDNLGVYFVVALCFDKCGSNIDVAAARSAAAQFLVPHLKNVASKLLPLLFQNMSHCL